MSSGSTAVERVAQVSSHLGIGAGQERIHARDFRPKLPPNLPVYSTPLNVVSFLLKAAIIRPHHPALVHFEQGRQWTYAEWATRVCHFVYALRSHGVKPGDRVLVCCPNTPCMADCLQAIPASQAVITPINVRLTEPEAMYILEHSGASLVIVDRQFAHLLQGAKAKNVPVIVCDDTGKPDDPYEAFLKSGEQYDKQHGSKGWSDIEFAADEYSAMGLCYTSGTTSKPKGVVYHHRGAYLAAMGTAVEIQLSHDSRYLWILPMFHALGWLQPYSCTLYMATQYCLRAVGDYDGVWHAFNNLGITHYAGAPTVHLSITSHKHARRLDKPVTVSVAGAPPTPKLIEGLEKLNIQVTHVYGLTETYGPTTRTYFIPHTKDYYVLKARQTASFCTADDIRVVQVIPEGEETQVTELQDVAFDGQDVGEIVMRGNMVMTGYYNNPEATAKAFAGGWFHSGDLAVRFPDGSFSIQDRQKDLIISGGENVSSLAVENAVDSHPDVHEVAVVGRPHEKWGERPHAFIVLKPESKWHGKPDAFTQELKRYLKPILPGFATPESLELVKELEKTSTGKVSKKNLRDHVKLLPAL